jgi:hypothetical protein
LEAGPVPDTAQLRNDLEEGLAENFHYAHCRRLGQLSAARVFLIEERAASSAQIFQEQLRARGIRTGDIKPVPLDCRLGRDRCFHGRLG